VVKFGILGISCDGLARQLSQDSHYAPRRRRLALDFAVSPHDTASALDQPMPIFTYRDLEVWRCAMVLVERCQEPDTTAVGG